MNQPRKEKILFALTLLAALFTVQPILSDFKTLGYSVGGLNFTFERLYYSIGLLLGIAVYFYAINFITERLSFFTQRVADFFYALTVIVLPLYFVLWGAITIVQVLLEIWNRPGFQRGASWLLAVIAGLFSSALSYYIGRRLSVREKEVTVTRFGSEEIDHFEQASRTLKAGYYDVVVLELYRAVEAALKKLLVSRQVYADIRRPLDLVTIARRHGLISEDIAELVDHLRRLRNEAVHSTKPIDRDAAEAAMNNSKAILSAIEQAANLNTDYITPPFTFSPDHRYGVMIPVFHVEAAQDADQRQNKVVELRTHHIIAVIDANPGYDRARNHHQTAPPRWSADSSVLLWKVNGKWFPDTLVLLKLEDGKEEWQIDLMKTAQREILARTRKAAPQQYTASKEVNSRNGSAYPDGFTVDVITDKDKIAFPFDVLADLTANPKQIEDFPANLESHLDAVVTEDGKFIVKKFKLGRRFQ
jgi:HEPN domain-containing protein